MKEYLTILQGKIFKLLPMKESYENGIDNHFANYVENLYINSTGFMARYPELSTNKDFVETCNNIAFLKNNVDIDIKTWRSIILRSVRLIGSAIEKISEE